MFQECRISSKYHTHPYIHLTHPTPLSRSRFGRMRGAYATGEQKNLLERQTFLLPYAVIWSSRACAVWQPVGRASCVGCV
jgi:hypothetical protein